MHRESTDIQSSICLRLISVWGQIKSNIEQYATGNNLTLPQIFLLHSLYVQDNILMGTLAKHLHCDASNVTGIVDRLESAGLIYRQALPEDRRAKQLTISPRGKAMIEGLIPLLASNTRLGCLDGADLTNLQRILSKVTDQPQ
jgi:DNA-binding MarR family transcriptional regulator